MLWRTWHNKLSNTAAFDIVQTHPTMFQLGYWNAIYLTSHQKNNISLANMKTKNFPPTRKWMKPCKNKYKLPNYILYTWERMYIFPKSMLLYCLQTDTVFSWRYAHEFSNRIQLKAQQAFDITHSTRTLRIKYSTQAFQKDGTTTDGKHTNELNEDITYIPYIHIYQWFRNIYINR